MTLRTILLAWSALAVIGGGQRLFALQDRPDRFLLACSVFSADTTEAALVVFACDAASTCEKSTAAPPIRAVEGGSGVTRDRERAFC